MEQLLSLQESNFKCLNKLTKTYTVQAMEYLAFQLQAMKSLRWRAQSTHDRLEEEINLVKLDNLSKQALCVSYPVFRADPVSVGLQYACEFG